MPDGVVLHGATVLLVDDDDVDILAVERAFREQRFACPLLVARDGLAALTLVRDDGARAGGLIVLLDLNLPRMNGIEFLEELRRDPVHRSTVVFVLTTSASGEDRRAAYEHNVAGYIVKSRAGSDVLPVMNLLTSYLGIVELP